MGSNNPKTFRVKHSKERYITFCLSDITNWSELKLDWELVKEDVSFVGAKLSYNKIMGIFIDEDMEYCKRNSLFLSTFEYQRDFIENNYFHSIEKDLKLPSKHAFTAKLFHERSKKSTSHEQKKLWLSFAHFFVPSSERQLVKEIVAERTKLIEADQKGEKTTLMPKKKKKTVLSDKISIKYTPEKGRHAIAAKSIEPGDVLANEMPYASVLLCDQELHRCHHCLIDLDDSNTNVWPCGECVNVLFCSRDCYQQAWQAYHRYECACLHYLWFADESRLAYRIIVQTSPKVLQSYVDIDPLKRNFQPDKFELNNYDPADFRNLWQLADNFHKHSQLRRLGFMMTANLFELLLERAKFEFDQPQRLSGLLQLLLAQIMANSHVISMTHVEHAPDSSVLSSVIDEKIAIGLYFVISMFNHCCEPNTVATFSGRRFVLRAIDKISQGGEVFLCYGVPFSMLNHYARDTRLSKLYNFRCPCTHCVYEQCFEKKVKQAYEENGETFVPIYNIFPFYPLQHCKHTVACVKGPNKEDLLKCDQCGHVLTNGEIHQRTKIIDDKVKAMREIIQAESIAVSFPLDVMFNMLCDMNNLKSITDIRSIITYGNFADLVARKSLEQLGQAFADPEYAQRAFHAMEINLDVVRNTFGPNSPPYTNELIKWADMVKVFGTAQLRQELRSDRRGLRKLLKQLAMDDEGEPGHLDYYDNCLRELESP